MDGDHNSEGDESVDLDEEEKINDVDDSERWSGQRQLADWTGRIASYLTQVIAIKVQRIKQIGDKNSAAQLVSDLAFYKRQMNLNDAASQIVFGKDSESLRTLN